MTTDAAHKRWWQIFEVVFGLPCLLAIALHWTMPLAFPRGLFMSVLIPLGAPLILTGLTFVVLARRALARQGQPTDPGQPTSELVTTGVFAISRNPLYLGGSVVLAGIAFAINWPWGLIFLLPALVACHYLLIAPEERYLAAKFGGHYKHYATSVRRWLGRH
ncbi:MAG: isoprenylcysteine carboxylmethyltransferase family protein [Caldilineaceae bacterium]|nr:isoprenylcysteine carboxylmethyltransferase family protein [Caldilineaceae bacterium]